MRSSSMTAAAGVVLLSACNTVNAPDPLLGRSEVYNETPKATEGRPATQSSSTTTVTTKATYDKNNQLISREVVSTIPGRNWRMIDDFDSARRASAAQPADAGHALRLFETGAVVIQTRCDLYFRQIGTGARDTGLLNRQIGLLTAALSAGLSLINGKADEIAALPIAAGLITGTATNFADAYFFSPDVQAVKDIVDRAFKQTRDEYTSGRAAVADYDDAVDALRVTQDVCTGHQIKSLVNKAVSSGTVVAQYETGTTEQSLALDAARRAAGESLGVLLSGEQLDYLFGYLQGERGAKFKLGFCANMPGQVVQDLCNATRDDFITPDPIAAKRPTLVNVFAQLDSLQPSLLANRLAALKARLEASPDPRAVQGVDPGPASTAAKSFTLEVK